MAKFGNYEMIGQMTNQNSGYSVWGFGRKMGREYFIKEFLSPKFPVNDNVSAPEQIARKIKRCRRFERQKVNLYRVVNEYSDGNAVRVDEFFRVDNKYYIAMPKVYAESLKLEEISALPQKEIRRLCTVIAHSMASLHRGGLVHADLKPTNILFTGTRSGKLTAKIIDFDSSFLESEPPEPGDEIVGDQKYFSPEHCMFAWEMEIPLTCKMDVFALGVLFHQYFTGELPGYDREQNVGPGEAVAKGMPITVSSELPEDLAALLSSMLQLDPALRPGADEVARILQAKPEPVPVNPIDWLNETGTGWNMSHRPEGSASESANPFFTPGDL